MARPWRRLGVRGRVVAAFLLLLLGAELVSLLVVDRAGQRRIDEQTDRSLASSVDDLRTRLDAAGSTLGEPGGPTVASLFDEQLRTRAAPSDEAVLTFLNGRPYAASAGSPVVLEDLAIADRWATSGDSASGTVATSAGAARWVSVPLVSGDRVLGSYVAVAFDRSARQAMRDTVETVSIVTGLVLVGATLLAWGLAGRALTPVRELASTARSITGSDDLHSRIAVASGDEVGDLARSFNDMLDHLEVAFDSQSRFLDGTTHELRTPITVVRGHVELLDDDPVVRAEEVTLVLDELDRMDRLVTDLRVLARSERPDFLVLDDVDLAELVTTIGRKAKALAPRRWSIDVGPGPVPARVDPHRLTQAVLGLVDNAVRVTDAEDEIAIGLRSVPGRATITVVDSGPGIEEAYQGSLFDPAVRTVRRRPGGTGLGLPIVAAIAAAHRGSVSVRSRPGAGATFEIDLPVGSP